MARRPPLALLALASVLLAAGCGSSSSGSGGKLKVVATTTQLGDIVRQIGGPRVDVTQILRPNTDPHDYEPRPDDVRRSAGAQLIVASGDNLDHWIGDVIKQSGSKGRLLDAGAAAPVRLPGQSSGPEASKYDPHWWHDPRNVEAASSAIAGALGDVDAGGAALYRARAKAYSAKVARLDAGIVRCIGALPAGARKLVTDHDAFGYFAQRYGLTVVGAVIPAQTTQAQPSAGDVAALVKTIQREHVKAVFPESSVNPKLAKAIARQTGASANLTLYGDTLGPADSSGATYLSMEQANADAIVRGLSAGRSGCQIAGI
jgi:zinc/manganese transport system substrate-binding protein